MPIFTTGSVLKAINSSCRCRTAGFSLIELLVVLVIIAVAAAGVSVVVNPQGSTAKQMNKQGDALYAQMQYALDEALFSDRPLGIVVQRDETTFTVSRQYHWYSHDGEQWQQTTAPLGEQQIASELSWQIEVEQLSLEQSLDALLEENKVRPVIVFYPSGEVTDFTVEIRLPDAQVQGDLEAAAQRYKIALNAGGELVRYPVGVNAP